MKKKKIDKWEMTMKKPMDIWISPTNSKGEQVDALEQKWWHKLIFWKKWVYADWFIKTEKISIKDLK